MRGLSEGLQPEQALTLPRANLVQILTLACQPYLVPGPRTPGSDGSRGNPPGISRQLRLREHRPGAVLSGGRVSEQGGHAGPFQYKSLIKESSQGGNLLEILAEAFL